MKIVIEVDKDNEQKAQAFIIDAQETKSVCFMDVDGMDTEFGIVKIEEA